MCIDILRSERMMSLMQANIVSTLVPANAHFPAATLYTMIVYGISTGMCATVEECQVRAAAIGYGCNPTTQAPDGQANINEMLNAAATLKTIGIRDDGQCHRTIGAALEAGINTIAWAQASRYLVAGWV
jgi:hypothetical protein